LAGALVAVWALPALGDAPAAEASEPSPAAAEMLKSRREKGVLSEEEYEDLYRRQAQYEAKARDESAIPGWLDNWTFGGDMRLRWDREDFGKGGIQPGEGLSSGQENVDTILGRATGVRDRYRVRLRLGAEKQLDYGFTFGFRIATSQPTTWAVYTGQDFGPFTFSTVGDPRSSNQTLGGLFTPKSLYLDRFYLAWTPNEAPALELMAGKFANPFVSPYWGEDFMVFDHDIQPEGFAATHHFDLLPGRLWSDSAGGIFTLNEIGSVTTQAGLEKTLPILPILDERDPFFWGVQSGLYARPTDWLLTGARASYYQLRDVDTTLAAALVDFGNGGTAIDANPLFVLLPGADSLVTTGSSVGEVKEFVADVFAHFTPFGERWGVKPFFQFSSILNADSADAGLSAGIELGSRDFLKLIFMWSRMQRNGSISIFTDSDMFDGFTNAHGYYLAVERQITRAIWLRAAYFKSEILSEGCAFEENGAPPSPLCDTYFAPNAAAYQDLKRTLLDRTRVQVDLNVTF
jgi:hypothetical protein